MAKKTEKPVAKVAEKPVKKTAEKPAKKVAEKVVEKPVKKVAEKPVKKAAEKPVKKVAEKVAPKTEKPAAKAKSKPMTKAEIISYMAEKMQITKKTTTDFLNEFAALAYKEAKKDFIVPGLGKLTLVQRKKRNARNPKTGETIVVPAKKVVKFRIAKAAKDAILAKKA